MKYSYSKEDLRAAYKAVLKALIVYHGFKHTHIAALIGMRVDTFSKWYRNYDRSLTVEEMKLFCSGLNISSSLVEALVEISINFRRNNDAYSDQLVTISRSSEGEVLKKSLGE